MLDSLEAIQAIRDVHLATAVVSLQTDDDIASRGLTWPKLADWLGQKGLLVERVPIEDFNDTALAESLDRAVEAIAKLRRAGHRVYVHCTAGLNRSPTVAIAYLVSSAGLSLEDACAAVMERRPCVPSGRALTRWWMRRPRPC